MKSVEIVSAQTATTLVASTRSQITLAPGSITGEKIVQLINTLTLIRPF